MLIVWKFFADNGKFTAYNGKVTVLISWKLICW